MNRKYDQTLNRKKWKIRDRMTDITTTTAERDVSITQWPYAIVKPSPPFALGAIVALCTDHNDAKLIVEAVNRHLEVNDG